ncbi:hypothetical protein, partial [Aeromonas sp. A35_P]|uniref:hypothetical protein n=1 Tax=Aeromonas sp. A35_P TaxID=1983805 RepID=UPI001C3D436D
VPFCIAPDFMDLAFLSGSQAGARRSVLALQSRPRRAKSSSMSAAAATSWHICGECSSVHHIFCFFVFRYLAIGQLKSTFAVRNINGKFPPSFKNMTECK